MTNRVLYVTPAATVQAAMDLFAFSNWFFLCTGSVAYCSARSTTPRWWPPAPPSPRGSPPSPASPRPSRTGRWARRRPCGARTATGPWCWCRSRRRCRRRAPWRPSATTTPASRSRGVLTVAVGGRGEVFRQVGSTIERDLATAEAIAVPITLRAAHLRVRQRGRRPPAAGRRRPRRRRHLPRPPLHRRRSPTCRSTRST